MLTEYRFACATLNVPLTGAEVTQSDADSGRSLMDEELEVVRDELEAEDLDAEPNLGDAVTSGGNACYCGTM